MWFPIISGIILIIAVGIFMSHSKKEEVKPEIVKPKEERPVLIEMIPKGTSNNPFVCKVNDEILLLVKGYSDYKKQNEVKLEGSCITWKKSCPVGRYKLEYGVQNIYFTPAVAGPRDLWVRYYDGKLNTSASLKIMVEV
jgi:hypothetical protein